MSNAESPRYLIGIDLGTTHTAVAFTDLIQARRTQPELELFHIPQLIAPGKVEARSLLPSLRYHPAIDELAATDLLLPWQREYEPGSPVHGELARLLGAKSQGRLVSSAKSWLSHSLIDRHAPILPWDAVEDAARISPVEASAGYLSYVRDTWNHQRPLFPLENQDIVLTVPASFDETARKLTLNASNDAGLTRIHLIEEPLAACYAWLWQHRDTLKSHLANVSLLLVIDVGGGTTDLTLISVTQGDQAPELKRIAVSNHLMLGGDNIDLMMAHHAEQQLTGGVQRLSAAEFGQLTHQCRLAKEKILSADAPETLTLTLLGSGAQIIGGARSVTLDRDEVKTQILDGFLPFVALGAGIQQKRSGVTGLGLPYCSDPAITRHISAFLSLHGCSADNSDRGIPDAVLFNGGLFNSPYTTRRILDQLTQWRGVAPIELVNQDTGTAVARGAVAYGLSRRGVAIHKVGGGSARSYFLQLPAERDQENPGICLLPKGTETETEIPLESKTFSLTLGQTVSFQIFSTTEELAVTAGSLVDLNHERFLPLPPLLLAFNLETESGRTDAPVKLVSCLTEIGTMEVGCLSLDEPERRWNMAFELRGAQPVSDSRLQTASHPGLDEALALIRPTFEKKSREVDSRKIKNLRQDLENILGARDTWNIGLLRRLFDELMLGLSQRKRSAVHERLWLNLAGYCLRPGYGDPTDPSRIICLLDIYAQGIQYTKETRNWAEWWTLWRRIAGGLNQQAQERIYSSITGFINPENAKRKNLQASGAQKAFEDMVRLAGSLERIAIPQKTELGGWLAQRLEKAAEAAAAWWALGRIGNRIPLYGSCHTVVSASTGQEWLHLLLEQDWKRNRQAAFSATLIARMSGDRSRDIDQQTRALVADKLTRAKMPENWLAMVNNLQPIDLSDENRALGEMLPPGLKLVSNGSPE
ncbi:hsp70 family protein [Candidatus Methylospira mobilis]|uniref:Hsp70 family protein n=1 Tax=Candidatus Methylospira mobilis TaxID=1808979 RepID=A0A5Q0BMI1_9GAMM|nr:Hsp70 family protein [Candidatus Methylospira mobilis]QFY42936.1 hsp70 family protein [Candidatus Methylospira mobilis]WNV03825.1 Hsp70 family protein [Candidatus Methylospira mobilis]